MQSNQSGRVEPAATGFPYLGQRVKRGQILGYVTPTIGTLDRIEVQEQIGTLNQKIALVEQRLGRVSRLQGTVAQREIDDARLELQELVKRRGAIAPTLRKRDTLRAPVAGVISMADAVAGQLVEGKEILFEIVDPTKLWIEASAYDASMVGSMVEASAVTIEGLELALTFVARGPRLKQQAVPLLFRIDNPPR